MDVKNLSVPRICELKIDPGSRRKSQGTKSKNYLFWILAGALFILGSFWIFSGHTVKVKVVLARIPFETGNSTILSASGYITARVRATVATKVTGRVAEMLVEEGMKVQKDQVLARLDDSDAKASYAAADAQRAVTQANIPELEVNLQDAQRVLQRMVALEKENVVDVQSREKAQAAFDGIKAKLELAKNEVMAAEARLKVAEHEIENCVIKSPFSGIAVSKDAQAGEIVSPMSAGGSFTRTGIATIVDMSSLEVEVDVSESYIAKVMIGQPVEATLDAYPDWHISGKVRTVIPTADRQKATVKVRIALDALDPKILPDMGVKVSFLSKKMTEKQSDVKALIPREALYESDGKTIVFVLKDGKIEKRAVKAGYENGTDVEIIAGIVPGEQLVLDPSKTLKEGQKVKVVS